MLVNEDSGGGGRKPLQPTDASAVIPVSQEMIGEETVEKMMKSVREALANSPGLLSLDLADVSCIDSCGLRGLLQTKRLCEESGTRFEIKQVSEAAARIIEMGGLTGLLGLPAFPKLEVRHEPDTSDQQWQAYEYVAVSDASLLSDLREKAISAARSAGASGDDICDIHIAVGEALTNAYRHGSPNKGVSKILMRCLSCQKAIVIEIADEGQSFDPGDICDPDISLMRDHGMGLFLMRQAMDVVEFFSDCPGNRVRMIKWL